MSVERALAVLAIVACIAAAAPARGVTRTAVADTQVSSKNADTNYGNQTTAEVGRELGGLSANVLRALLHFDLSGLGPPTGIASTTLRLFINSTTTDPLDLALALNLLDAPFDENTVTWNTQPGILPVPTVNGTMNTPPGAWFAINVTDLVRAALAGSIPNDLFLRIAAVDESTDDDQNFTFLTREDGAATAPQLVVETIATQAPVLSAPMTAVALLALVAIALASLRRATRPRAGAVSRSWP